MANRCQVCEHPHRAEVELGLANKIACRILAKRHGLDKDAIWRHGNKHMAAKLKARLMATGADDPVDLDRLRISESEGLLQHLVAVRGRLYRALDTAEGLSPGDVARVAAPLHKNLELTGKLLGDLRTGGTQITNNTLVLTAEYHQLRVGIVAALKPYPQAREAVANVLQRLETIKPPLELTS